MNEPETKPEPQIKPFVTQIIDTVGGLLTEVESCV
jgi:hypothetical protein